MYLPMFAFVIKFKYVTFQLVTVYELLLQKVVAEDVDEVKEVKKKGRVSKREAVTSSVNTVRV